MFILQLCRWKFSHTKNFVADFIRLKLNVIKTRFLSHLWELRGNVRTPSIARRTARGGVSVRHNWTFFADFCGWDVISGNLLKSVFRRGGSLLSQISDGRGVIHQPLLVPENYNDCSFVWYQNIRSALFGLSLSTRVTDRQTDGRMDRITTANTVR